MERYVTDTEFGSVIDRISNSDRIAAAVCQKGARILHISDPELDTDQLQTEAYHIDIRNYRFRTTFHLTADCTIGGRTLQVPMSSTELLHADGDIIPQ